MKEDRTLPKQGEIAKQDKDTWLLVLMIFVRKEIIVYGSIYCFSSNYCYIFSCMCSPKCVVVNI